MEGNEPDRKQEWSIIGIADSKTQAGSLLSCARSAVGLLTPL
jgi:hypothetical protein